MFQCRWPKDYVHPRVRSDEYHLRGDFLRKKVIIGVQVLQPFPTRQFKQPVARRTASAIGASFPANATVKLTDDIKATVDRPIVNHNDFFIAPSLRKCAFDRLRNPALRVKAGDQN